MEGSTARRIEASRLQPSQGDQEVKRYDNRKSLQQGKPTERWEYVPKTFGLCVHPSLHHNYEIDLQSVVEGGEFEAWKWVEHIQKKTWVTPTMLWNLVILFRTLFSCIDRAEFEHVRRRVKHDEPTPSRPHEQERRSD